MSGQNGGDPDRSEIHDVNVTVHIRRVVLHHKIMTSMKDFVL
jgi:hypothetical protein